MNLATWLQNMDFAAGPAGLLETKLLAAMDLTPTLGGAGALVTVLDGTGETLTIFDSEGELC